MAKTSISLVSVQKPTANTPVLQRRNKFTAPIEQQITKIGLSGRGSGFPESNSGLMHRVASSSPSNMASSHSNWSAVSQR